VSEEDRPDLDDGSGDRPETQGPTTVPEIPPPWEDEEAEAFRGGTFMPEVPPPPDEEK
jgi:hypothetical protein